MKNKIMKISIILITILFVVFITNVEAKDMIDQINKNIKTDTAAAKSATSFGNSIIGAIQVIGTGIAVIMLLYIAIKYMVAAPSEKAEYKKTAVSYAIGATILFSAMALLELIKNVMTNLSETLITK